MSLKRFKEYTLNRSFYVNAYTLKTTLYVSVFYYTDSKDTVTQLPVDYIPVCVLQHPAGYGHGQQFQCIWTGGGHCLQQAAQQVTVSRGIHWV